MRVHYIILFAALLCMSACNQNSQGDNHETTNSDVDTLQTTSNSGENASSEFNLEQVPVSEENVGEFPYLTAPVGYRHGEDKEKTLEEKYFFYNDSLVRKINGQYFHTTVYSDGDVFEDTYLVNEYKKAIEKLGGVAFYSGGLPAAASDIIRQENPNYVSDMYDVYPYKYKQFLIRTAQENIWIELCHGLNAQQIDLTVVKEAIPGGGDK